MLPLLGLTGCGGGDDAATGLSDTERAGAQALSKVDGMGLQVRGTYSSSLKRFVSPPDSVFYAGTAYEYIVPNPTMIQAVRVSGSGLADVLSLAVWEGVSTHHRSVALKLKDPAVGKVYDMAAQVPGEAAVAVHLVGYDSSGAGYVNQYDYLLNKGTVRIVSLTDTEVVLEFTGVVGSPTAKTLVPANKAARGLQLDGQIRVMCRHETEDVAWLG